MTPTHLTEPPRYPYCGRGADPGGEDPVGCRGHRVRRPPPDDGEGEPEPYGACLAHLSDDDRDVYLAALGPGSDLNHCGTTLDAALLGSLLAAVRDPATGQLRLGDVDFKGATFEGGTWFRGALFEGKALFTRATFKDEALFDTVTFQSDVVFKEAAFRSTVWFRETTFQGDAEFPYATFYAFTSFDMATFENYSLFRRANFENEALFRRATFNGNAVFREVTFEDDASFDMAIFEHEASFSWATFKGYAGFDMTAFRGETRFRGVTFHGDAHYSGATFAQALQIGPMACRGTVDFSAAVFDAAVIIEVAARALDCRRTRWASTAALRLRHATVDLSDAVLEYPMSVTAHDTPPPRRPGEAAADESGIEPTPVRLLSLRGADAAHLSLTGIDLTACRFAGTVHLDQLRLYGRCPLSPAPGGWHRRGLLPVRYTARQTLAEEQHWRARAAAGWAPPPDGSAPLEPTELVPLYRELRKAFEDGKNEPGAADFYYGEMEMRRHDPRTPPAERFLLRLYWALSGYGLRASRALGWLLGAMAATVLLMMAVGLPDTPAQPHPPSAGVIGKQDPGLHAAFAERFTGARAQKAVDVVVNSVVFRSSGQDLTTAGRYTEMASRFTEPVLLGLAALAIRGRVKR